MAERGRDGVEQRAEAQGPAPVNKQAHVHGRPKGQDRSDFVAVDLLQDAIARKDKAPFRCVRALSSTAGSLRSELAQRH